MKDTLREFLSYGSFLLPLLRVKKTVLPRKIQWGGKDQYFLHYAAPSPKNDTLVLYLHGGGWNSGSPSDFHFIGQKIALEGYDCILPGYRKVPDYHYHEIAEDVFRGFSEIKQYLYSQNLAYSNIIVMGSSAGAHLGALLCFDRERQKKYGIDPCQFGGLISLAGPLCFDLPQTGALNKLLKDFFSSRERSVWKEGEPISKLERGQRTRVLIVQSRHDGVVGFEQAERFCERAAELDISAELWDVPERQNTHSAYSAGIFLKERSESPTLSKVLDWMESV